MHGALGPRRSGSETRGEVSDGAGQQGWLVQGNKGVAVWDLHRDARVEKLAKTTTVLGRHHAVLFRPYDQGGPVVAFQAFSCLEKEMPVGGDSAEHPYGVGADSQSAGAQV